MQQIEVDKAKINWLVGMLMKADFLKDLSLPDFDELAKRMLLYRYENGEVVYKQGDRANALYIIHTGKVGVSIRKSFFKKLHFELGPGSIFGEMALVSNATRSGTLKCIEQCEFFVLLKVDFDWVRQKDPSLIARMERIIARRQMENAQMMNQ